MSLGKRILLCVFSVVMLIMALVGVALIQPSMVSGQDTKTIDENDNVVDLAGSFHVSVLPNGSACTISRDGRELFATGIVELEDGDMISTDENSSVWIVNERHKTVLVAPNTTLKVLLDNDRCANKEKIFLMEGTVFYDIHNENISISTFGIDVTYENVTAKNRGFGFLFAPSNKEESSKKTCIINLLSDATIKTQGVNNVKSEILKPCKMIQADPINKQILDTLSEQMQKASWETGSCSINRVYGSALPAESWTVDDMPRSVVNIYTNNPVIQSNFEYFKVNVQWWKYVVSAYTLFIDNQRQCMFTDESVPKIHFENYIKDGFSVIFTTEADGKGVCYFSENRNNEGKYVWNDAKDVVFNQDLYLFTHYEKNKFTVLFDANGGACNTESFLAVKGSGYGKLPDAVRDGYAFEGWYTKKKGGSQIYESDVIQKDVTLYAHWKKETCIITLDWQSGKGFKDEYTIAFQQKLKENVDIPPSVSGYEFDGFYAKAQGGGAMYYDKLGNLTSYAAEKVINDDLVLYAHWIVVKEPEAESTITTEITPPSSTDGGYHSTTSAQNANGESTTTNTTETDSNIGAPSVSTESQPTTSDTPSDDSETTDVKTDNLSSDGQETSSETATDIKEVETEYRFCKPTAYVNVRTGPSTSHEVITTIAPNTELLVLTVLNVGWTKIQTVDGSVSGYMSNQYLSFYNKDVSPPTFTVSLSKSVVKIAKYQTIYIKATPSASEAVFWKTENKNVAVVIDGMIYGVSPGSTIINVTDLAGNVLASVYVTVTNEEPVRFAYATENIAEIGQSFKLKAITDSEKDCVKFVLTINDEEQVYSVTEFTTQSCVGNGIENTVRVWTQDVVINAPGTYSVKAYSGNQGVYLTQYKEFSCFVVSSVDSSVTSTEKRRASTKMLEYIAAFEGYVPVVTPDALAYNIPTVGYGYVVNVNTVYYNNLTKEEAFAQLVETINSKSYASALNVMIERNAINMSQAQFDALVSFNYNLGSSYWNRENYVFDLKNMILNAVVIPEGYFAQERVGMISKAAGCTIYAEMNRTSAALRTLEYGAEVTVVGYTYDMDLKRGWYKVQLGPESYGYIHCGYVSLRDNSLKIDCNYIDSFAFGTEIIRWHHAGGKCYAGLLYRRLAEGKVFAFGKYEDFNKSAATYKYNLYDFDYPTCMPSYNYKYPNYQFTGGCHMIQR